VGIWHPGVLAAVLGASILAWYIGASTTSLVLRVGDPWRRVVYLSLPVAAVAVFTLFLPFLLFYAGWTMTHPTYVHADLFGVRLIMVLPLVVAFISSSRHLARLRGVRASSRAAVG
jgi:hypothetical protein